jgi:Chaperone of endosialidase
MISELRPQFVVKACEMKTTTMKNPKVRTFNNHLSYRGILFLVPALLAWTWLAPLTQAVVPPPDGGYPNFNTAEGEKALFSLTTGQWNTALGGFTLWKNTDGSFNTAVGTAALLLNVGDQSASTGIQNTAVGAAALLFNSTGSFNTATGVDALFSNTSGSSNTATGVAALSSNTTGVANTAMGDLTLSDNTEGDFNTASGFGALHDNTTGSGNTANGSSALQHNTTGGLNAAFGGNALLSNTEGTENTATGANALSSNINGSGNTAIGVSALLSNTSGVDSTAVGSGALFSNIGNGGNTAIGHEALGNNTTGIANIALGWKAGLNVTTADGVISIGAFGANVSNSCYIGQIWQEPGGSQAVYVNSEGKLGAQVSSRRFKDEVKPMNKVSEAIYRLKPVSFRYKAEIEPTRPLCFGLIAEEVEKVRPDLIVRGSDGKVNSVRYDAVNAMLLNEFLKEHQTVQELKKQVAQLTAGLQKVSAKLELSKSAPQTVLNNR